MLAATRLSVPLLLLVPATSCNHLGEYQAALRDGQQAIPYARDFTRLFPEARSFFSYYTGEYGPTTWNSEVAVYGRYELTLQVEVSLDSPRRRVVGFKEPAFYLVEVTEVRMREGGGAHISHGDTQLTFGKDKWTKVVEAGGDLAVLGLKLIKNAPVPGIEKICPVHR